MHQHARAATMHSTTNTSAGGQRDTVCVAGARPSVDSTPSICSHRNDRLIAFGSADAWQDETLDLRALVDRPIVELCVDVYLPLGGIPMPVWRHEK